MSIATFSLPIDIPWQRIAFSRDMIDKVACDRELPLRWRSSLAIFEYEPPEDQQRLDGFRIKYLKVACTITGYQPNDKEIRIRERIARSGWTWRKLPEVNLTDEIDNYYACYGAMLEVVVAPPANETVRLEDYPYFADFDPKKRELYELVTESGEVMSRSLEDVGIRLGQTTSQSHEVRDTTSVGAALGVNVGVVQAGGSINSQSGTVDVNQRATENVRTTDAARESRETLSYTTQLSQMYHQLNSYHLGTNRAAFFIMPRPHVVQSTDPDGTPRTFVDGPRQLEGVQEFMLVVVRPKNQEHICVEAYLETAHLFRVPQFSNDASQFPTREWTLIRVENAGTEGELAPKPNKYASKYELEYHKRDAQTFRVPDGFVVDTSRGDPLNPGIKIESINRGLSEFTFDIQPDHVTIRVDVIGMFTTRGYKLLPSFFDMKVTVFLKKTSTVVQSYDDTLFLTARAVCSCAEDNLRRERLTYEKDLSIVYEKQLVSMEFPHPIASEKTMSIQEANRMGNRIHREMLQSLSNGDRYPRGMVGFLDTQLVSNALNTYLQEASPAENPRLSECSGIPEHTLRLVTSHSPSITRGQLLQMPLARQVEDFGLSFMEAVDLRRALTDLTDPTGPPPVFERQQIPVPLLTGMEVSEARKVLSKSDLIVGRESTVDSPLPSGTILAQEPSAGTVVQAGTEISITLASGLSVRIPEVIGLGLTESACALRHAGLRSEPNIEGPPVSGALVVAIEPSAGTLVTPKASVTIRLK